MKYSDIIFDQVYNASFQKKLQSIQYKAALAVTGATSERKTLSGVRF